MANRRVLGRCNAAGAMTLAECYSVPYPGFEAMSKCWLIETMDCVEAARGPGSGVSGLLVPPSTIPVRRAGANAAAIQPNITNCAPTADGRVAKVPGAASMGF
jgi:hypothetical protein